MLAIINARIESISNGRIVNGKILIKDGKIFDIGCDIDISGFKNIIDAKGRTVTPGIIDAHTHVGISEAGIGWEGNDSLYLGSPPHHTHGQNR